jgi:ABC-type branched-subunit amino acid transport system substrate-binding protein
LPWQMDDGNAEVAALVKTFRAQYPKDSFNENTMWGFGAAAAYADVLTKACEAKDLSRAGVMKAFTSASSVDSLGLLVPLNYTKAGKTPSKHVFIHKVDPQGVAGEKLLTPEPYVGPKAESYELS